MRQCNSCFRYCEDWRDAEAKGLKNICYHTFGEYHRKPRPGVKVRAIGVNCPGGDELRPDLPACENHEYRWHWNLKTWWRWHFKQSVINCYRKYIRVPIGGLRKPMPLIWQDYFDGIADRIIPNGEPACPHCGEMPYSYEQCVFCGQRLLPNKSHQDRTALQREMREGEAIVFVDGICPECGCSCGNGGYGPLRCRCGWVGDEREMPEEVARALKEIFEEV